MGFAKPKLNLDCNKFEPKIFNFFWGKFKQRTWGSMDQIIYYLVLQARMRMGCAFEKKSSFSSLFLYNTSSLTTLIKPRIRIWISKLVNRKKKYLKIVCVCVCVCVFDNFLITIGTQ
jgi:hypothetical protein